MNAAHQIDQSHFNSWDGIFRKPVPSFLRTMSERLISNLGSQSNLRRSSPKAETSEATDDHTASATRLFVNPLIGIKKHGRRNTKVFDICSRQDVAVYLDPFLLTFINPLRSVGFLRSSAVPETNKSANRSGTVELVRKLISCFMRRLGTFFMPDTMFTNLELEFQRFHANHQLGGTRKAFDWITLGSFIYSLQAFLQPDERQNYMLYRYVTVMMLMSALVGRRFLYKRRTTITKGYRLQCLTVMSGVAIASAHFLRVVLTPSDPKMFVVSNGALYPLYLLLMAGLGGLTFPFFLVGTVVLSAWHVICVHVLRQKYLDWGGHTDVFRQINIHSAEASTIQSHTSFDEYSFAFYMLVIFVASELNRIQEMKSRSYFLHLRRLNHLECPRIKLRFQKHLLQCSRLRSIAKKLKQRARAYSIASPLKSIIGNVELEIEFEALVFQDKIGEGASGQVYRGWFGRIPVGIKKILFDELVCINSEAMVTEAKSEAHILAKLRHPNVLRFYGLCNDTQALYLVTQLCSLSLRDCIYDQTGEVNHMLVQRYLQQMACGIAYLHHQGIVHRDLKPANVLLDIKPQADGRGRETLKICDFGQSKRIHPKLDMLQLSQGVGTPVFCAPEVQKLGHILYSQKIDVYSFGIIIWALFMRQRPYSDTNLGHFSLIREIVENGLRPRVPPFLSFPPNLKMLMERCWAADPQDRPTFDEIVILVHRPWLMLDDSHADDLSLQRRTEASSLGSFSESFRVTVQRANEEILLPAVEPSTHPAFQQRLRGYHTS